MRPKKRVLLVDGNAERRAVRALIFSCWGLMPIEASRELFEVTPLANLRKQAVDVAVIEVDGDPAPLLARLRKASDEVRVLVIAAPGQEATTAEVVMLRRHLNDRAPGELIQTVLTLSLRKRGPRAANSQNALMAIRAGHRALPVEVLA